MRVPGDLAVRAEGVTGMATTVDNRRRSASRGLCASVMASGVITPNYAAPSGTTIPWFKSVTVDRAKAVDSVGGASSDLEGYSADYPSGITLRDVDLDATAVTAQYANLTLGRTNLDPSGTGVTVTRAPGRSTPTPIHCDFPAFPEG